MICVCTIDQRLPTAASLGSLELLSAFQSPTPTGVPISHHGRIFVTCPKWDDTVEFPLPSFATGRRRRSGTRRSTRRSERQREGVEILRDPRVGEASGRPIAAQAGE